MGGWNLYLMCGNNVVNRWDVLGLHYYPGADQQVPRIHQLARTQARESKEKMRREMETIKNKELQELTQRLVALWKKDNNQPYKYAPCLSEKECVRIAQELAIVIIDAIYNKVGQTIDKYDMWPIGGWLGNIFSPWDENAIYKVGFSYRCGFWSKLIYTETEDYFLHMSIPESTMNELTDCSDEMKNNIFKSMQTAFGVAEVADEKHAWIEIYGPNTEYGEYEKKGGYKKGDFSIDPWKKGGKEIQYHVDKKIPISTPSRSIHLRRYTTNQKNE
jgi:hypothetical protein